MVVGFSPTPEEDLEEKNKLLSMVVVLLERELETEPELESTTITSRDKSQPGEH